MTGTRWQDTLKHSFRENIREYTMIAALLVIWFGFGFLTEGIFLSTRNLSNLFVQTATTAILAMGMVLIIVAGHIDLSVGSTMGFCGALAVMSMIRWEWTTVPSMLLTLLVGTLIGAWHGYWVAYRKIPAFIVTLASMLAFRGAIIGLTDGQTLGLEMIPDALTADRFKALGQGYLPTFFAEVQEGQWHDSSLVLGLVCAVAYAWGEWRQRKARLKHGLSVLPLPLTLLKALLILGAGSVFFAIMGRYLGIPFCIILVMALALALSFVTERSVFGRQLYAIGGNADAAKFSGINIQLRTLGAFTVMGLLVALAGLVSTARLNAATTSAGQNAELDAIASAVIGGTSLMGGEGTIRGAIVGALVMTSLDNGMSLMNMDITYQYIIKGAILMAAVWADMASRKA